jgi:DNA-binding FadR family transcriptional regulator
LAPHTKTTPPLRALKSKQLLYQTVQEEVKAYIIQHSLKPGDPLPPETHLAEQLNISRNSVREAVKALEALGILEARPGTGLFVRDFSFEPILNNLAYGLLFDLKQLNDILEARYHLESSMAEKVVQNVTVEQVNRLHGVLDIMLTNAKKGMYSAEMDRIFHQYLNANVNNTVLMRILDIFWQVLQRAEESASFPPPDNPMQSYQVHVPIVEALEAHDIEEMRNALMRHYNGMIDRLRRFQARSEEPGDGEVDLS